MMAEIENLHLYFLGTAGSGKTKLAAATKRWMSEHGHDAVTVNLDPGAESLPYAPDVDIRDWIRLSEVMETYGLGPNGAQVAAADLLAMNASEIRNAVEGFRSDYVLVDTPGQVELWIFREAGRHLTEFLAPGRSALLFLVDPFLAKNPSAFVSQVMLAATTQFRFQIPMLNVLSKSDLLQEQDRERIQAWMNDTDLLYDELARSVGVYHDLNLSLLRVLQDLGTYTKLTPASGETLEGVEDIYTFLQQQFMASEDLDPAAAPND